MWWFFLHLLQDLRLEGVLVVKNRLLHLLLASTELSNNLLDLASQITDYFIRFVDWRLSLLLQSLHLTLKGALELILGSFELLKLAHKVVLDRFNLSSRLSVIIDCLLKRLLTLFQSLYLLYHFVLSIR